MKKELTLQDYISLILRRRWSLLIATGAILLTTGLYTVLKPPVYRSEATFMLETQELSFTEKGMGFTDQSRPLGYYEAVMKSRIYRRRVLEQLTAIYAEANGKEQYTGGELDEHVRNNIALSAAEYTDFIKLTALANDPDLAFHLARTSIDVLKERCREIDREELQNAVDFIDNQQQVSKANLEQAERNLQEFKKRTNLVISDEDGTIMNELVRLENELTDVQTKLEMARANLDAYRRRREAMSGVSDGSGLQESPQLKQQRTLVTDLENRREELLATADENDPRVVKLDSELEIEKRKLVNLFLLSSGTAAGTDENAALWKSLHENIITEELNVFVLENRERYFQRLIRNFKAQNPRMMEEAIELMRMTRAQKVAENLYSFLLEKGEEAKIKAATGSGGMRIIDEPTKPTSPVSRSLGRNLVLGLFLGLGVGFGIALVREFLDNSIQSKDDIAAVSDLTVLGSIPGFNQYSKFDIAREKMPGKDKKPRYPEKTPHLISEMKPKSPTVEAYRNLRSSLNFAAVDKDIKSLVISSPSPMEGKTVTTANLAISYALLGRKVLIVDADLRKPKQHELFRIKEKPGLMEYLVEKQPFSKSVHKTGVGGLFVLPCGTPPPNPSELIASRRMGEFMDRVRDEYDLVLYDSAPLLPVSDTLILSSRSDGLLLVVKHGLTNKHALEQVVDNAVKAREISLLGVVLNQVPVGRGYGYYDYSYYDKGYY